MNITGTVKIIDFPDQACLTTVRQLLLDLERYLAIELPVEKITNVYVSATEPEVTDRDIIWERINNAGNYIGRYHYIQGEWVQLFPTPNQITMVHGDSRYVPTGYQLISNQTPGFTSAMVNHLQEQWLPAPEGGYYVIFHVVYVGV